MAELTEQRRIYYIPDNFIEEGRILQGKIKLRHLYDAVILAAAGAAAAFAVTLSFPYMELEDKIPVFMFFCLPPACLGIIGFNGDPISVAFRSFRKWRRNSRTMLYNPNPRLLKRDPLLSVINQTSTIDTLLEIYETKKQENIRKKAEITMKEGEDFEFVSDEYVDRYTRIRTKVKGGADYIIDRGVRKTAAGAYAEPVHRKDLDVDAHFEPSETEAILEGFRPWPDMPESQGGQLKEYAGEDLDFY